MLFFGIHLCTSYSYYIYLNFLIKTKSNAPNVFIHSVDTIACLRCEMDKLIITCIHKIIKIENLYSLCLDAYK